MKNQLTVILAILLFFGTAGFSFAVKPGEQLSDPKLEQRARTISKGLRCVVCQNQSIDDSDAELAGDMRKLVRERILAGDSDQQVQDFMVERYGNFVLMKPPLAVNTLGLWLSPVLFILIGVGLFWHVSRRKPQTKKPIDTDETEHRLEEVLNKMKKN